MKNANSHHKPSPADTPSNRPNDEGHQSIVKKQDKQYKAKEPHTGDIAKKHENDEQPVHSVDRK